MLFVKFIVWFSLLTFVLDSFLKIQLNWITKCTLPPFLRSFHGLYGNTIILLHKTKCVDTFGACTRTAVKFEIKQYVNEM